MPRPDDPDGYNNAPAAELNPLLNPVLSKNMGRWAEVYFNSPPDRRDQAVLELIRELENEQLFRRPSPAALPSFQQKNFRPAPNAEDIAPLGPTCLACGYVNRPQHRFCGRCGERLDLPPEDSPAESEDRSPRPFSISQQEFSGSRPYRETPTGHDIPVFGIEPESAWHSYRPYIGLVLAVIVVTLAYVAWRGSTTSSAGSSVLPAQAPSAAADPVSPGTTPSKTTENPASPAVSAPTPPPEKAAEPQPEAKSTPPVDSSNANPIAPSQEPAQSPVQPASLPGHGGEELAAARDFLNGTNGRQQNLGEAAQWLWRSVRKQNLEATLLLSGLYLRGEGVPKNCEQARLLLDAAAVKGSKDAAERLRNLRAFGCE